MQPMSVTMLQNFYSRQDTALRQEQPGGASLIRGVALSRVEVCMKVTATLIVRGSSSPGMRLRTLAEKTFEQLPLAHEPEKRIAHWGHVPG